MSKLLEWLVNTPKSLVAGLRITMRNMTRTKATQYYPEVMPTPVGQGRDLRNPTDEFDQPYELAPRFRGLHGLTKDETGDLNCIGCMACANVCPDDLISMDLEKREGHNGRFPVTFTVNIGPCCFCGLCSEVCPTPMRAIVMTDKFEWATYERHGRNLTLTREDLERNGDYEVERRRAGRQWSASGELLSVNPEEEGNPYFQFAAESPKTDRKAKKAEAAATATADSDPQAEFVQAVKDSFAAAGVAVPEDLEAFDADSLKAIEDKQLYAKAKAALVKALRAGVKRIPGGGSPAPATVAAPVAEPPVAAPEPVSSEPDVDALRAALAATLAQVGVAYEGAPEDVDAAAFDGIEDRKLRGQAKSGLRKLHKALGRVE